MIILLIKSQKGVFAIITLFAKLTKEELEELIISCEEYKGILDKNLKCLTEEFGKLNFNIDTDEFKSKNHKKISKDDIKTEKEANEDLFYAQLKEVNLNRKISSISANSTKYLSFFARWRTRICANSSSYSCAGYRPITLW